MTLMGRQDPAAANWMPLHPPAERIIEAALARFERQCETGPSGRWQPRAVMVAAALRDAGLLPGGT